MEIMVEVPVVVVRVGDGDAVVLVTQAVPEVPVLEPVPVPVGNAPDSGSVPVRGWPVLVEGLGIVLVPVAEPAPLSKGLVAVPVLVPVAEPMPLPEGPVAVPVLMPVAEPVPLPAGPEAPGTAPVLVQVAEPVPLPEGPVAVPVLVPVSEPVPLPEDPVAEPVSPVLVLALAKGSTLSGDLVEVAVLVSVVEPVSVCEGPVEVPVIVLPEKFVEPPGICVQVVVVVVGIMVVTVIV